MSLKIDENSSIDDINKANALQDYNQKQSWSWLKPAGVAISGVNMAMNLGMYGTKKDNLKTQTNLYNTQISDLNDKMADRKVVRDHNRRVML